MKQKNLSEKKSEHNFNQRLMARNLMLAKCAPSALKQVSDNGNQLPKAKRMSAIFAERTRNRWGTLFAKRQATQPAKDARDAPIKKAIRKINSKIITSITKVAKCLKKFA